MTTPSPGLGLGQLLLALDRTMVTLVEAPRGLDMAVGSVALVDADDVRLGLAVGPGSADLFFLLGVADAEAVRWLEQQFAGSGRVPAAIFVKEPSEAAVARAVALGTAVVAVDPRARWESLYRLVNHAFEHHGDRGDPHRDTGTDLFGLAQSIADRTRGMVSIEDEQSHVLAYSASNDEADELRRLTILGRAGPPEHLEWIGQWGIFDALRAGGDVVRVAERPELGLRPRLAVGIHLPSTDVRRPPAFAGTIWLQQGSAPLADDTEEILRGGAVLAARIMARLASTPSTHAMRVTELLGFAGDDVDTAAIARDLGITADGRAALVGFQGSPPPPTGVIALSASAFRADAQAVSVGERVYVLLPKVGATSSVMSWARGVVAAMQRELGLTLRAVVAAPLAGLAGAAAARVEVDRVFDSADRHPGAIGQITSLDEAHTTVLLDEIVSQVASRPSLIDPRVRQLRAEEPILAETLRAYLDAFGDVSTVAKQLHVHPNTVRYRVRRIEKLVSTSLDDPDVRLVFSLGLRATDP
ncbi:transcriptional regulator [Mycolicibacterium moriokaense]|jgi:DNA-binding PucR family transcriptional regulator|uniref:Transcriptional regulator n=1 Tax=Mycolicibacterium moriokaense TaxID=39691 RepID=A0AAD1M5A2_9MYCO|nr:PucR family transcriptional regulator [Mycolicibacterium moriokaense]MCV7042581.1 helix-turn-helix domain-containing protein [Mycolicibacterium moriokaense]ORB23498.1 transcriptional regulator [Mycolicibacterium moriokaense]BBX01128.1 transcriptional regulator [Mycolicibacterium moriokaense]